MAKAMTHEDLRKRAVKWLTNSVGCSVVLSEMVSANTEIPDAIGWKYAASTLVECKTSRSDFFRDGDKCFVRSVHCMGNYRYFLVPDDLISDADLVTAQRFGYGLLYAGEKHIQIVKKAERLENYQTGEIAMLTSALRRVQTRQFLTIVSEAPSALEVEA